MLPAATHKLGYTSDNATATGAPPRRANQRTGLLQVRAEVKALGELDGGVDLAAARLAVEVEAQQLQAQHGRQAAQADAAHRVALAPAHLAAVLVAALQALLLQGHSLWQTAAVLCIKWQP